MIFFDEIDPRPGSLWSKVHKGWFLYFDIIVTWNMTIKLDLGHRITEKFNQPVATKMVQKQNPLLTIFKIGKWKSLGEDFSIRPLVQKLVHNYSLARIKPYMCGFFGHNLALQEVHFELRRCSWCLMEGFACWWKCLAQYLICRICWCNESILHVLK